MKPCSVGSTRCFIMGVEWRLKLDFKYGASRHKLSIAKSSTMEAPFVRLQVILDGNKLTIVHQVLSAF